MRLAKSYRRPIRCSYWNINGHKSKVIGNKLNDPQFLKVVSDSDILSLAELHTENDISVPGFRILKQKIGKKIARVLK